MCAVVDSYECDDVAASGGYIRRNRHQSTGDWMTSAVLLTHLTVALFNHRLLFFQQITNVDALAGLLIY